MRILITGSRTWTRNDVILDRLAYFTRGYSPKEVTVVHGGAKGADEKAGELAALFGFNVEVHPADWDLFGKRAGYIRNAEMVSRGADVCLAFIHNQSRGATMCAELAEKADIKVFRWLVED